MVGRTNVGSTGGSSTGTAYAYVQVTYPSGSICTATNGLIILSAPDTSGLYVFGIPQPSSVPESWSFSCTDGSASDSESISISGMYQVSTLQLTYGVPSDYTVVLGLIAGAVDGYASYVDTGLGAPGDNEEIEVVFRHTSGINSPYGPVIAAARIQRTSPYTAYETTFGIQSGKFIWNSSTVGSSFYGASSSNRTFTVTINNDNRQAVYTTGTGSTEQLLGATVQPSASVDTGNIFLFSNHAQTSGMGITPGQYVRINSYKRKNKTTGNYIQDFVPCKRNIDNQLGFYDLVSRTFYQVVGTTVSEATY